MGIALENSGDVTQLGVWGSRVFDRELTEVVSKRWLSAQFNFSECRFYITNRSLSRTVFGRPSCHERSQLVPC